MTACDLNSKICEMLPIKQCDKDFRETLQNALAEYLKDVEELDESAFSDAKVKLELIGKIKCLNEKICEVVSLYYGGRHGEAFALFQQQMNGDDGLFQQIGIIPIQEQTEIIERDENGEINIKSEDTILFRAREFEDKRDRSFEDMFHVPLNQRVKVRTQRYSSPGYPCLYLGKTIYACWEEMHRPRFDDLMFSGFKVRRSFKVYDLRIPRKEMQMQSTLLQLPLIIACMVKVKNEKEPFKPEYIIPQLLIETIICNNHKNMASGTGLDDLIWGVTYTSSHVSKDFPFGYKFLDNIALPVIKNDEEKNCPVLASLFEISDPLCLEYEGLKDNQTYISWGALQESEEEQLKILYQESKMGYMEGRIRGSSHFHNFPYMYVNNPGTINLDQEGSAVPVDLRTNLDFVVNVSKEVQ